MLFSKKNYVRIHVRTHTHTHTIVLNGKQPLLKVHNKIYFELRLTEIWYIERRVKKVNIMDSRKHEGEIKKRI